jgi:hypothetical protein
MFRATCESARRLYLKDQHDYLHLFFYGHCSCLFRLFGLVALTGDVMHIVSLGDRLLNSKQRFGALLIFQQAFYKHAMAQTFQAADRVLTCCKSNVNIRTPVCSVCVFEMPSLRFDIIPLVLILIS